MSLFSLFRRHVASFLSMFKLVVIGLIIVGKDPFALFGMQAPGIWEWGQGNKVSFYSNRHCHQQSDLEVPVCALVICSHA